MWALVGEGVFNTIPMGLRGNGRHLEKYRNASAFPLLTGLIERVASASVDPG